MKCYFHNDLDGICSGAIIKHVYPACEMISINYGQEFNFEKINKNEIVFMVDFCLQPFDLMEKLSSISHLHWIDHHKTAIDEAHSRGFLASGGQLIENGKAGCELTWQYIHPTLKMPVAVHLLGRYDVWDHSEVNTLPFQYGMRIRDAHPGNDLWDFLLDEESSPYCSLLIDQIISQGKMIIEYEKMQSQKFCDSYAFETCIEKDGQSFPAICVNKGLTNSQIFDSVYDQEKHALMITFCRLKPPSNKWTVSLYSTRDDVDCGMIAKSFGGGGHKGAAGFSCEELPFNY